MSRVALGHSPLGLEEAQAEGQVEGERHEHGIGRDLQRLVPVDGVLQTVHEHASLERVLGAAEAFVAYHAPLDDGFHR